MLREFLAVASRMVNNGEPRFHQIGAALEWINREGLSESAWEELVAELKEIETIAPFTPILAAIEEVETYDDSL